mgnify:CR=1 FL=1|tara:strand:+ start:2167 stop:2355 length:189 start_codon:yes stop_codon:yes gene_type:complete
MSNPKKYILTIEFSDDSDVCDSVTEELIYDELCLIVDDLDITEYFDREGLELCKDCYDIAIS